MHFFLGALSRSKVNARAMRGKRARRVLYSDQNPPFVCRLSPPVSAILWHINPNLPPAPSILLLFLDLFPEFKREIRVFFVLTKFINLDKHRIHRENA